MAPTAIVIPVPEAEPAIDLLRREHTRDGAAGMPAHVTLLYPFTDSSQLVAGRIHEVRQTLQRFPVFDYQLTDVRRFDNFPNESYAWLAPAPHEPFIDMVKALVAQFPEHPAFGGAHATIIPHVTIAASADPAVLDRISADVESALPIRARAVEAWIMDQVDAKWVRRTDIPLGPG